MSKMIPMEKENFWKVYCIKMFPSGHSSKTQCQDDQQDTGNKAALLLLHPLTKGDTSQTKLEEVQWFNFCTLNISLPNVNLKKKQQINKLIPLYYLVIVLKCFELIFR